MRIPKFRQHQWSVWGHHLRLSLPEEKSEVPKFIDTRNKHPGQESLGFYDSFYDQRSEQSVDPDSFELVSSDETEPTVTEQSKQLQWLNNLDGDDHQLICDRRRFVSICYPKIYNTQESFFTDIWVMRHAQAGDLRAAKNLQKAETQWLNLTYHSLPESEPDWINRDEVVMTGLNWRQQTFNGALWQGYEEHNNEDILSQVWLYPLGNMHYLKLRLYRMGFSGSKQFHDLFQSFCQQIMERVVISPPAEEKPAVGSLTAICPEQFKLSDQDESRWRNLDQQLQSNTFNANLTELTPPKSVSPITRYSLYVVVLTWIIMMLVGSINTESWLEKLAVPHSDYVMALMFFSALTYSSLIEKWSALVTNRKDPD